MLLALYKNDLIIIIIKFNYVNHILSLAEAATDYIIFVATNTWQKYREFFFFCRDKHSFIETKDVIYRDKHVFVDKHFVATKTILVAAPANDNILAGSVRRPELCATVYGSTSPFLVIFC